MQNQATRRPLGRAIVVWGATFFLVLISAVAGSTEPITIIVPIGELEFESPVLPPPLWRTNYLAMKELALIQVQTFEEKVAQTTEERAAQTKRPWLRPPRLSSAVLSYEGVDGEFGQVTSDEGNLKERKSRDIEYDGDIFSAYFKMVWDSGKFSYGALVPYDNFNLVGFDANRIGVMLFGNYKFPLSEILNLGFTLNGTYIYNKIDSNITGVEFKDFNTFGGNASIALSIDTKDIYRGITMTEPKFSLLSFTGSLAFSYQINKDDVERMGVENRRVVKEVEAQHVFMLGANIGMRMGNAAALTLYGIWSYDATTYRGSLREVDDDYFDIVLELAWSFSPRWRANGGYKKLIGYEELENDQIFIGVSLRL